jgi:predicted PurR-regulated permease PerM
MSGVVGGPELGRPGPPLNRRSPFLVGLAGAAGVAVTYGLVELVLAARGVLVLIGLALFIAIGLDPAVARLGRWLPRRLAVAVVALGAVAVFAGFVALALPPLIAEGTALVHGLPRLTDQLRDHSSTLGRLNDRYHLEQRMRQAAGTDAGQLAGGVFGAGQLVLSAGGSVLTVAVLSVYFLVELPRIRRTLYRLFPARRRERARLLGDEIFAKVGGFVVGNLITSVVAGAGTFLWLVAFGVPYPLLLALFVALMDLIPIVGSTVGGIVVSLVALTVSLPVALATLAFYVVYRLLEDYLLVPRVMARTVETPGAVTLVAVLLGGTLLGIPGALVAIPAAAAVRLVLNAVVFPRLDRDPHPPPSADRGGEAPPADPGDGESLTKSIS